MLFKSYYVVWKLFTNFFPAFRNVMFKSYYVVWKPEADAIKKYILIRFKSYYVVWKLFVNEVLNKKITGGLNRTM